MIVSKDILSPQHIQSAIALGFFDGVHLAHRAVISRAVKEAERSSLVPCVFTFDSKGAVPAGKTGLTLLQTEEQKDRILSEMGVERVYSPDFDTFKMLEPRAFVEQVLIGNLGAKVLVCGYNYHFGKGALGGVEDLRRLCQPYGTKVIAIEPVYCCGEIVSSTRIRQAVRDGLVKEAALLLGSPFTIEAKPAWHKMANTGSWEIVQTLSADFTVPKPGKYVSEILLGKARYIGETLVEADTAVRCITYLHQYHEKPFEGTVKVSLLQQLDEIK